jgi:squalene-hopene/tetraprenyl-beta-curcumene cyclase
MTGLLTQSALLVTLLVAWLPPQILRAEGTSDWNKDAAGKYLDKRAKAWFKWSPAQRGDGEGKSICISCHTVFPYALARPVLRKLTGAKRPTKYEKRLLGQTRKRVANWKDLDSDEFGLLYDFSEQKKRESRGTEAILNSLVLAFHDQYQGRKKPSDDTKLAFSNLWAGQVAEGDREGAWEWLDFGLGPWESKEARYYGAAVAALAVGTAPGYYEVGADVRVDKNAARLRRYLRDNYAKQNLHNRLILLWASTRLTGLLKPQHQKGVIDEVLRQQRGDGGWSTQSLGKWKVKSGASDGYATGLIVFVLSQSGKREQDEVKKAIGWLRKNQDRNSGAWVARSVNKDRKNDSEMERLFMSDAATAFAVLALGN